MPKFVVVRNSDTMIMVNDRTHKKFYASMGRAVSGLKRMIDQNTIKENEEADEHGMVASRYTCYELEHYLKNIKRSRTVTNLMSGKEVEEDINTPYSCSVASESYWQS